MVICIFLLFVLLITLCTIQWNASDWMCTFKHKYSTLEGDGMHKGFPRWYAQMVPKILGCSYIYLWMFLYHWGCDPCSHHPLGHRGKIIRISIPWSVVGVTIFWATSRTVVVIGVAIFWATSRIVVIIGVAIFWATSTIVVVIGVAIFWSTSEIVVAIGVAIFWATSRIVVVIRVAIFWATSRIVAIFWSTSKIVVAIRVLLTQDHCTALKLRRLSIWIRMT